MKILLLGNGFDISYKLPTCYINFINTVSFLINHYNSDMKTAGDIFSREELQQKDSFIKECYQKHQAAYDATLLDREGIQQLIEKAKENLWFSYLIKAVNKSINWIDFEKEIGTVLFEIQESLKAENRTIVLISLSGAARYVLSHFGFFLELRGGQVLTIKKEYLRENPIGSKDYEINTELIVERLTAELNVLMEVLQIYLSIFVDKVTQHLDREKYLDDWPATLCPDYVVTFNYTKTYELLFSQGKIFHIHGDVDDRIVLGINPDEDDKLESVNTTFLPFKKYFQRVVLKTDVEYLKLMAELTGTPREAELYVMGHSLDKTDVDIIQELFDVAERITIMHHNSTALSGYVRRLVEIYAKEGLDYLRSNQELTFVSLQDGLPSFFNKELVRAGLDGFDESN